MRYISKLGDPTDNVFANINVMVEDLPNRLADGSYTSDVVNIIKRRIACDPTVEYTHPMIYSDRIVHIMYGKTISKCFIPSITRDVAMLADGYRIIKK